MRAKAPLEERSFKLILEYDGAAFFGFQRQPGKRTVQSELEKALSRLFNHRTKIKAASGRTDTGVHASYQVVHIRMPTALVIERIQFGLNYYLPQEMAVRQVEEVPADFHARFGASSKTYEYRIWNHSVRSPLRARHFFHVPRPLNVEEMRRAAARLKGRHNFSSFCSAHSAVRDPVRWIQGFRVLKKGCEITLSVTADGFLYHMVRNLAGALIEVGTGRLSVKDLEKFRKSQGRQNAPFSAPAHGLSLVRVFYGGKQSVSGGRRESVPRQRLF